MTWTKVKNFKMDSSRKQLQHKIDDWELEIKNWDWGWELRMKKKWMWGKMKTHFFVLFPRQNIKVWIFHWIQIPNLNKKWKTRIWIQFFIHKMNDGIICGNFLHFNTVSRIVPFVNNHINIFKKLLYAFWDRHQFNKISGFVFKNPRLKIRVGERGALHAVDQYLIDLLK